MASTNTVTQLNPKVGDWLERVDVRLRSDNPGSDMQFNALIGATLKVVESTSGGVKLEALFKRAGEGATVPNHLLTSQYFRMGR